VAVLLSLVESVPLVSELPEAVLSGTSVHLTSVCANDIEFGNGGPAGKAKLLSSTASARKVVELLSLVESVSLVSVSWSLRPTRAWLRVLLCFPRHVVSLAHCEPTSVFKSVPFFCSV